MTKFISDLTLEEQNDLYSRYISNEPTHDLLDRFNIRLESKQLFCNIPPEVLEEKCTICSGDLLRRRQPKTLIKNKNNNPKYCSKCRHTEETNCNCRNCRNQQLDEKKLEEPSDKEKILNLLNKQESVIDFEKLNFAAKIGLGALLHEGISDDFSYIKPLRRFNNPFAPTDEFSYGIIDQLLTIKAIVINPKTNPKFIKITDYDEGNYDYYPNKVKFSLNVESENLSNVELIKLIINSKEFENSQCDEALQLWKIIALYESIEYFKYSIKKFMGIDCETGYKTNMILNDLINNYSVSQIYGIIKKAVMKAVVLNAGGGVSRKHAVNSIPRYLESIGEKAKIKNRDLKKHKRDKACPESALSIFFFDRIIKIGYEGFSEVPHISKIKSNLAETA